MLFWGILGALVMRAIFIVLGAALLQEFHWVIYLFGGFLVFTGAKLLLQRDDEVRPEKNPLFRLFRRFVPSVSDYRGGKFTVVEVECLAQCDKAPAVMVNGDDHARITLDNLDAFLSELK